MSLNIERNVASEGRRADQSECIDCYINHTRALQTLQASNGRTLFDAWVGLPPTERNEVAADILFLDKQDRSGMCPADCVNRAEAVLLGISIRDGIARPVHRGKLRFEDFGLGGFALIRKYIDPAIFKWRPVREDICEFCKTAVVASRKKPLNPARELIWETVSAFCSCDYSYVSVIRDLRLLDSMACHSRVSLV